MSEERIPNEQPGQSSPDAPAAAAEEPPAGADLASQLAEANARVAEYLDGWQRTQAEFLNYKKRQEREQSTLSDMLRAQNIKKVLPVLDDLERALGNRPADSPWADGIELVVRKFQAILDGEGVKRIEAEGQPFDPNLHEAISQEPSETVASGHVIAVIQQGYMLGDRVLRHALVRVAA